MLSTDPIWTRIKRSGLATESQTAKIRTEFEGETRNRESEATHDQVLDWLAAHKRISGYQRQVLDHGHDGPFVFDDYLIYSRSSSRLLRDCFQATHRSSGHPVHLFFCGGANREAAKLWQQSSQLSSHWSAIRNPFVWTIFEAVAAGDYRLIVTSHGSGKTMLEKVLRKGRMPWLQVCQAMEHLALGLQSIHESGLVHGRLSPAFVWLQKTGACQIIPPLEHVLTELPVPGDSMDLENPALFASPMNVTSNISPEPGHDLFSLGQIAVRLITGSVSSLKTTGQDLRQQEIEPIRDLLAKYNVPTGLKELVYTLLTADVAESPVSTATIVSELKYILAGQSTVADIEREPQSLSAYCSWLRQRQVSTQNAIPKTPVESPDASGEFGNSEGTPSRQPIPTKVDFATLNFSSSLVKPTERVTGRRRSTGNQSRLSWVLGAVILFVAVVSGLILAKPGVDSSPGKTENPSTSLAEKIEDSSLDGNEIVEPDVVDPPRLPASSSWLQQTIVDLPDIPWESPTAGQPLDVAHIPPAPEFLFAWHPARMLSDPARKQIVRSLGPEFMEMTSNWEAITGIPIDQIDHMWISLHAVNGTYDVFVHAILQSAKDRQPVLSGMGDLKQVASPIEHLEHYRGNKADICLLLQAEDATQVTGLLLGTGTTIDDSLASGGVAACDRYLVDLIARSDRDRDASLLFINSALISEEGTKLFAGTFARIRRPLHLFFNEHVRAVLFSFHSDQGSYLEMMTEQSVDLDDSETVEDLQSRIAAIETQIADGLDQVSDLPYWDSLQKRFVPMLAELVRATRVGSERDGVIANCWLPPAALHNLIAASEMAISLGHLQATEAAADSGPQSLMELLATRRTLKVTNSPDLRVLLEDFQNEVRADFSDLPFVFAIKLRGDDLQADGITQNQRPGSIDMVEKSISEILTRIMFQANPDKDATGPNDPKCKLVWVVAPDPDNPQQQAVLITTRSAAKTHQYELPTAFVE